MSHRPFWLRFAPILFLALWSLGYPVAKIALQHASPMTILGLRFACVLALMGGLFAVLRPPLPQTRREWGHLAIVGFLLQAVYFGMAYFGFQAGVGAGTMALIMSFQPILVALIAPFWTSETVTRKIWIGLALGLAGALTVIVARAQIEAPSIFGFTCAFLALFGITAGSLWEKRFGVRHHPVTSNLIQYAAGFLGILPLLALQESFAIDWDWPFVWAMAYLVIGNSVIAVGLLLAMIRVGEVARVSALFFLVPPLAAILAWLMIAEVMPQLAWAGFALASAGVYIATRKPV